MNYNVEGFPQALVGQPPHNLGLFSRATERVQGWFLPPDRARWSQELDLRREERLKKSARIAPDLHDTWLRSSETAFTSLEQAFSDLLEGFAPARTRFRIVVIGRSKALKPAIQEQIYLIGREALVNALRHSNATSIDAHVEYLSHQLHVVVRDNGSGIDPHLLRPGSDSHRGLPGMRERASGVGAQVRIWSRPGAGTEVEITVPWDIAAGASS